MFTLRIAFRNLWRQRKRSFFTGLMMVGGYLLTSIYIGFQEGSYGTIIEFFTRDHTGHLQIHAKGYLDNPSLQTTLNDWPSLRQKLSEDKNVAASAPRVFAAALAFTGPKTTGVRIVGVDPLLESSTSRLREKISVGQYWTGNDDDLILVSQSVAKTLGLKLGDEVAMVGQGADGSVANGLFRVAGLVGQSGEAGINRDIFLTLGAAQKFLALEGRVHEVAVLLREIALAPGEAASLTKKWNDPRLDIEPWQAVEKDFYNAMVMDRKGDIASQVVFLVLVAIGVLNTVLMNLLERVPEYGLLKCLGTRASAISAMIVWEMLLLAVFSIVPGAALSFWANSYLAHTGIHLPNSFTFGGMIFSTMYGSVIWSAFLIPAAIVVGLAVVVSLPAAVRVWRLSPIDALRRA